MVQASEAVTRTAETTRARLDTLRKRAAAAGQEAEQMLREHGLAPEQLTRTLSENAEAATQEFVKSTRHARKRLAKRARRTRKELLREAKQATREARQVAHELRRIGKQAAGNVAAELETRAAEARHEVGKAAKRARRTPQISSRRWPWLLGAGIAVAVGVIYVLRYRSTSPATPHDEPESGPSQTGGDEEGAAPGTGGHSG